MRTWRVYEVYLALEAERGQRARRFLWHACAVWLGVILGLVTAHVLR